MRVKQISVTKLFGVFNHTVPLNIDDDRITIIIGPNGFGKTTLLQMLDWLFNGDYYRFLLFPFERFEVAFDNGNFIHFDKSETHLSENVETINANGFLDDKKWGIKIERNKIKIDKANMVSELSKIVDGGFRLPTGQKLDFERFINLGYQPNLTIIDDEVLQKLQDVIPPINIHLIKTQRLSYFSSTDTADDKKEHKSTSTVVKYSQELAEAIETTLAEFASLSQSLDRTFPTRLIQQPNATNGITEEDIHKALEELEETRTQLRDVGLLDKEENINIPIPSEIDNTNKNALSIYIEDNKKKFSVFDTMSAKIALFKEIVNSRFQYKTMTVSKNEGFSFSKNAKKLSPTDLSSGEQHTLIVFYELLFKVKPNTLILIDEPELSLHVDWLLKFLPALKKVAQLASLDILMATHSPDIINDQWDLTVELKGPTQ